MVKIGHSAREGLGTLESVKQCKASASGRKNECIQEQRKVQALQQDNTWTDLVIANMLLVVNWEQKWRGAPVHQGAGNVGYQKEDMETGRLCSVI